jgi:DNA-binding NarL/FixJ family response regulator
VKKLAAHTLLAAAPEPDGGWLDSDGLANAIQQLRAACTSAQGNAALELVSNDNREFGGEVGSRRWTLCDCFRHAGHQYLITRLSRSDAAGGRMGRLTARERSVAQHVARGQALKVVASACFLSIQAVSTYLGRAKRKLGVSSRADLIRMVLWDEPRVPADASLLTSYSNFYLHAQLFVENEWFRVYKGPPAAPEHVTARLTPAETDVLTGILQGLRNAQIAEARRRSVRTVTAQVSTIMRKCGAASRAELVACVLAA